MSKLSRRDFLKISATAVGGALLAATRPLSSHRQSAASRPNIIVLVLDAMSARHLSLHGYSRKTTPNLEQITEHAIVYHNHHSGGSFTTPGSASMLMGLYPWTHRAFGIGGMIARHLVHQNVFGLLGRDYYRFGYTQNRLCNILLEQFTPDLDEKLPVSAFSSQEDLFLSENGFPHDPLLASYYFHEVLNGNLGTPPSLSLGYANLAHVIASRSPKNFKYPLGIPSNDYEEFYLDDLFAGLLATYLRISKDQAPFFIYSHLFPPHHPYSPQRNFIKNFLNDGATFPAKPSHPLAESYISERDLGLERLFYDSYIADLDHNLGIFFRGLTKSGLLDSAYLIITSDHGELFERSQEGHGGPLLYEGVTHIPLLVLAPGQTQRKDIYSLTSNVDLVPSILALAGSEIPANLEGRILPGLGGSEDPNRSVFTLFSKENSSFLPLTKAVAAIVKDSQKLIYYRGYPSGYDEKVELYDLKEDPEEMHDLSTEDAATTKRLKDELLTSLDAADRASQQQQKGES